MLIFANGRYCSQVWFMEVPTEQCNFLGALFRDSEHWTYIYRFRYDEAPERGRWYMKNIGLQHGEDEVLEEIEKNVRSVAAEFGCELESVAVRSDDAVRILAQLSEKPWMKLRPIERPKPESEMN